MIELKDIRQTFADGDQTHEILKGINLTINEGEFLTIMGPSGCGKSTLLHIAALLSVPTSGRVYYDGHEVDLKKEKELERLRRKKIGLVFQNSNLIDCLTPFENVQLAADPAGKSSMNNKEIKDLFEQMGIGNRQKTHVKSLSGGEAQRVALLRALVNRPSVVFCDEPTGALDMETGHKVIELLMETRKQTNCSLVIVTHDQALGSMGERCIQLYGGEQVGMEKGIQAVQ